MTWNNRRGEVERDAGEMPWDMELDRRSLLLGGSAVVTVLTGVVSAKGQPPVNLSAPVISKISGP
jgi:hypothetical protein